jgi:hypothetical protein
MYQWLVGSLGGEGPGGGGELRGAGGVDCREDLGQGEATSGERRGRAALGRAGSGR